MFGTTFARIERALYFSIAYGLVLGIIFFLLSGSWKFALAYEANYLFFILDFNLFIGAITSVNVLFLNYFTNKLRNKYEKDWIYNQGEFTEAHGKNCADLKDFSDKLVHRLMWYSIFGFLFLLIQHFHYMQLLSNPTTLVLVTVFSKITIICFGIYLVPIMLVFFIMNRNFDKKG